MCCLSPWKPCLNATVRTAVQISMLLYGQATSVSVQSLTASKTVPSLLLYGFAEFASPSPSQALFRKSLQLSFSSSLNLLMKEWMTFSSFSSFSSFNLTLSDFWGIPKSNGWNRLRSRAEIKCSFKSHFLFFNSPHFNKDPLSLLFPKLLFPF